MPKVLLCNALYKGGVRPGTKLKPFRMPMLTRAMDTNQDHSTLLSLDCASALTGGKTFRVGEVGPRGVTVAGKTKQPPFIKIRTREGAKRIYVTEGERSQMAELWGLPPVVIEQAYFSIEGLRNFSFTKMLEISPAWQELLDPEWHAAFMSWLSGRGPLPETVTIISSALPEWAELPDTQWKKAFREMRGQTQKKDILSGLPWITASRERIAFPAIDPACCYKIFARTRLEQGQMQFLEFQDARFARFTTRAFGSTLFAISPDSVRHCGSQAQDEDYKKAMLIALIAPGKTSGEYCFSLRAGKKGAVSLGLIKGLQIKMKGSELDKVGLEEGELYYFKAERIDQETLRLSCYLDAERKKLYGWLQTGLRCGFFAYEHLTLRGA